MANIRFGSCRDQTSRYCPNTDGFRELNWIGIKPSTMKANRNLGRRESINKLTADDRKKLDDFLNRDANFRTEEITREVLLCTLIPTLLISL